MKHSFRAEPPTKLSSLSITAVAIVFVIVIVTYLLGRSRRRCPYQNPLCRSSRPCLLCYRDLFRASAAKRGAG
jgi:hypothetical protein